MKLRPVRRYKAPGYPTRQDVLKDPRLLRDNLPPRWQRTPQLAGVLALLIATNACVKAGNQPAPKPEVAIVAPLFEHGDGRGAWGCVVVSPPSFLSEEEAIQVITEELSNAGVPISRTNVEFPDILIPKFEEYYSKENGELKSEVREIPGSAEPLTVDLVSDEKHIAIEYLSQDDYFNLGGAISGSSVQGFDFADVARGLDEAVKEQGDNMYFGAFYDPMVSWDEFEADNGEQARELLRQQMRDFLNWLAAQGAI